MNLADIVKEAKKYEAKLLSQVTSKVTGMFVEFLRSIDYNNIGSSTPNISIIQVVEHEHLNLLYSGPGFYVIATDFKHDENGCIFPIHEKFKAIYRGHSGTLKRRIESHLFNETYNAGYEKRKEGGKSSEMPFTACMKIENGINGINVDKSPYSDFKWYVIQHKMPGSSELIRKQVEAAFDDVFNKPLANRDR
ncbi:MAG: hypothetical protein V1708_06520 [Candidatus Micrarchaeota archaeon]